MNKSPSFQFYPADWLNDVKLKVCSLSAKGLLMDLMCLMHQSEKYGFLTINEHKNDKVLPKFGQNLDKKKLQKILSLSKKKLEKPLKELLDNGVLKQDENGIIFCKRMVHDEYIRNIRREAGSKGGNPSFKKGQSNPYNLVKQKDKQKDKQKITPSSSSSSSSPKENISLKRYKKEKKKPLNKIKYFDEVFLTQKEYDRLIEEYGEKIIQRKIEDADNYLSQGNNKKKYTNHNKMIRTWLRRDGYEKIVQQKEEKKEKEYIKCPGCKEMLKIEEMNEYNDGLRCQWCNTLIKSVNDKQ